MEKGRIILGVIGADCHSVGNKILEKFFTEYGFDVINLGVLVSQEEFVEAAKTHNVAAILVSSIYGQGEIDCEGFRKLCTANGLKNITIYVGGNLVIGKSDRHEVEEKFKEMGYDRVFHADCNLEDVAALLEADIKGLDTKKHRNNEE